MSFLSGRFWQVLVACSVVVLTLPAFFGTICLILMVCLTGFGIIVSCFFLALALISFMRVLVCPSVPPLLSLGLLSTWEDCFHALILFVE